MLPSFGTPPTQPVGTAAASAAAGAGAASAADPAPVTGDADSAPEATAESSGRPRWLLPVVIGAVVLVVALVVGGILLSRGTGDETPPPVASTVVLPSPTPTVEPAARTATTAFTGVLPTSVLQYALTGSAPDDEWLAAGAVEAYSETYGDGADGQAVVRAGQWETPQEATDAAARIVATLPTAAAAPSASATAGADGAAGADAGLPQTGEVVAAGVPAGTYTIVDAGDGTGVAVWTNGSSLFHVVAPVEDVADFYAAYPL